MTADARMTKDEAQAIKPWAWLLNNFITVMTVIGLIFSCGAAYYELNDHEKRIATLEKSGQEIHELHDYFLPPPGFVHPPGPAATRP